MKIKFLFISIVLIICLKINYAQPKVESYSINFEAKNLGFKVDGNIQGLKLNIQNLEKSPEFWNLKGSLQIKTLNTHNSMRDRHLMEPDYFDLEKYPEIFIETRSIKDLGQNQYLGNFLLTLKGTTKSLNIPFSILQNSPNIKSLNSDFKLNRRDFGIGGKSLILQDSIKVRIRVQMEF